MTRCLFQITILSWLLLPENGATAFSLRHQQQQHLTQQTCRTTTVTVPFFSHRESRIRLSMTKEDPIPNNEDEDGENKSMDDFLRDLRDAKASKLGGVIPEEQLKESAVKAESDFLQAMKETKDEFNQAKKELGSAGAVDMFLDRIRKEDDEGDGDENVENEDDDDDLSGIFQ